MTQDRMADRPMLDKNAKVVESLTDLPERLRHYNPQSELMLAAADRIEDADRRIAILESVIEKLQCELAAAKAIPREPTDDMLRAGHATMFVDVRYSRAADIVKRGYKAMIAEALK
jgi:uncharacterized small protein (DUF1192 family)